MQLKFADNCEKFMLMMRIFAFRELGEIKDVKSICLLEIKNVQYQTFLQQVNNESQL